MNTHFATQLDFLEDLSADASASPSNLQLIIELDQRTWMKFLSEEWLFPDDTGRTLLGVNCAIKKFLSTDLKRVEVSFDLEKLPASKVMVWRDAKWSSTTLNELVRTDTVVAWDGPLPLFAVDHFTVDSLQTKAHLLAMVRNFADIEVPSQAIEVGFLEKTASLPTSAPPIGTMRTPMNWDALRGAASMALLTVPAIAPWLQGLCDSLSNARSYESENAIYVPWLKNSSSSTPSPMWSAMMEAFSQPGLLKEWNPRLLLDAVCTRARALGGDDDSLDQLVDSTMLLIQDRGTIETLGVKDDVLGLVFQLLLLRPRPERYMAWKEDWPAIQPKAWWTGAILSGYLCGFRALPLNLRGSFEARKYIALRTFHIASANDVTWADTSSNAAMTWAVENESIVLRAGRDVLAEHKFSNRGRWYQLDLTNPVCLSEAIALAQRICPDLLRQTLVIHEGQFQLEGNGRAKLDAKKMMLSVEGKIEIPFGQNISIEHRLATKEFRDWLANASMPHILPRPSVLAYESTYIVSSRPNLTDAPAKKQNKQPIAKERGKRDQLVSVNLPDGFSLVADFITQDEETGLLESIDQLPWDTSMRRRVQHYGWKYDYKARKVDPAAHIGALPNWAQLLGERLFAGGFLTELPDQVIINEYVGAQGISKHIDCLPCFRGAVVTISLNESWEMVFSRKSGSKTDEKVKVLLPRRSAAILDGEARNIWLHEIPSKLTEAGVPRGRRVSITFRKVDTNR